MKSNRLNFTKSALNKLALSDQSKQYATFYDTEVKKLTIQVYPSGNKVFYLSKKIDGKAVKYKIGAFPDVPIEDARTEAQNELSKIAKGDNPQARKRALDKEITFGDFFNKYEERHAKLHKKSCDKDRGSYELHLNGWANRKLSSVDKMDVQKLHATIGSNNGQYIANRILALVRAVYNKAIEWGMDVTNPAVGIQKFKEKSRERFLHRDEMQPFFEALTNEPNTTLRDFFLISLFTGARRANVQEVRWKDVHFERATWQIEETKNGTSQIIPLSDKALVILKQRFDDNHTKSNWVFPSSTSKTGHVVEPKTAWKRILLRAENYQLIDILASLNKWDADKILLEKTTCDKTLEKSLAKYRKEAKELNADCNAVGLTDLRIHDLRRTLGSWLAANGANSYIIGKTLNHKSTHATAVYARLNTDPVREAVKGATDAMLSAALRIKNR